MTKKWTNLFIAAVPFLLIPINVLTTSGRAEGTDSAADQAQKELEIPSDVFISNLTVACEKAVNTFNEKLVVQSSENLKTRARQEVRNLIYYLNKYPDKDRAQGWIKYLQLESLRKTLDQKDPDPEIVAGALERFEQDEDGLEMDCFTQVRNRLRDYVKALSREDSEILKEDFAAECSGIPQTVQNYFEDPSNPENPDLIATSLDFMNDCQPDSQSIRDISNLLQKAFVTPNVVFSTNAKLLFPEEPISISEPTTVQEYIRGTPVYGTGVMTGTVLSEFVPNSSVAEIMLTLKANIKTTTTAVSSGVTVLTNGDGNVLVKKPIFVSKDVTYGQSASSSSLSAVIAGINTGRGPIGSQVVYDRVQQEFPYSTAESQRLMEQKVVNEFESRINAMRPNDDQLKQSFALLRKFDYTPAIKSKTTKNRLEFSLNVGSKYQIGPISTTNIQVDQYDTILKVHQTALNNPAHFIFTGVHLSEKDLKLWIKENLPFVDLEEINTTLDEKVKEADAIPAEEEVSEDDPSIGDEDFYVNFSEILPISVSFNDGLLGIHLRLTSFEQKGRTFPGLNIDVIYNIEKRDTGYFLTLKESEAWPADIDRGAMVPARYQVIRRQVKNRMNAVIPNEIEIPKVELKEFNYESSSEKESEAKIRGHLVLKEIRSENGWLVIGANVEPAESAEPETAQESTEDNTIKAE